MSTNLNPRQRRRRWEEQQRCDEQRAVLNERRFREPAATPPGASPPTDDASAARDIIVAGKGGSMVVHSGCESALRARFVTGARLLQPLGRGRFTSRADAGPAHNACLPKKHDGRISPWLHGDPLPQNNAETESSDES
jgi:hypothetical protein